METSLRVWCDASFDHYKKIATCAVVLEDSKTLRSRSLRIKHGYFLPHCKNINQAETEAIYRALSLIKKKRIVNEKITSVVIHTDSQAAFDSFPEPIFKLSDRNILVALKKVKSKATKGNRLADRAAHKLLERCRLENLNDNTVKRRRSRRKRKRFEGSYYQGVFLGFDESGLLVVYRTRKAYQLMGICL